MAPSPPVPAGDRVRSKRWLPRTNLAAVALLAASLGATACGGGSNSPGVASIGSTPSTTSAASGQGASGSSAYQDAVAYAQCMRAHGVGNWPDPQSGGGFILQGAGSSNPSHDPGFSSANTICQHLLANGGQPTVAQQQKGQAAALRYAQCMRAHGILNFPDPTPGGNINLGGNESIDHNTPQFKAALTTCVKVLPGGGPPSGGPAGP